MGIGVITMGNLAFGQSMVIDVFGNVRVLNPGETPNEGEVIVTNNADLETNQTNELETVLIGADGAEVELTKDIAEIFSALEEGQDPTQLGDALATAAGGSIGSSLIDSGTVERIGDATIAETEFATQGLEQLGLSRTQSLTLIEQFNVFDPELVSITGQLLGDNVAFITAEDTPLSGRLFASDLNNQDQLTFIQSASPANGEVIVNTDGTWSYTPDENYDGPDRFEVTVSDGNGGTDTITVSVTVTPIPEISITGGGEVNEGDDASYVISFDKPSDQTTTLKLTTELGTAEGNDFGAITVETSSGQQLTVNPDGTVNVPVGTTSLNVTIATSQDDVFEGDESFTLNVEPVTGLVGIGSSDALIKDDGTGAGGTPDNDKPTLQVTGGGDVNEGSDAIFDVSLSNKTEADVVLNLAPTTDGSYSAESDDLGDMVVTYVDDKGDTQPLTVAENGDVLVPAGITDITVTVPTSDNETYEGDETFGLVVTDKSNITINGSDSSDATIKDDGTGTVDDGKPVDNDKPTLQVTGGGDVNEGSDATFEVSLSNKTEADVVLNLAPTTDGAYSVEDSDLGDMVVTYVDADDKTQTLSVADNGDVTVPAGITEITVTVATSDNEIYEGDETFALVVTDKSNVTTNGSDSSNATIKDDGTGPGDTPDNDKPTLLVNGGGDVNEGSDATFEVSLSNKTEADVVLNLAPTIDGSYSAESDDLGDVVVTYVDDKGDTQSLAVAENGDVLVPAGITDITVTVPTSGNEIYEGDETFGLVVTDKSNVTTNGSDSSNATIKDDGSGPGDTPDNDKPILLVTGGGDVNEGSDATFEVSLSNKTEADVVLNLAPTIDGSYSAESDDLGDVVVTYVDDKGDTQSLAVTENGDVLVPAGITDITVTVPTSGNEIYEGDETFGLVVTDKSNVTTNGSDSSNATIKDDGTGPGVTPDNDKPTLQVTGGGDVNEGSDAIFDVSLSNKTEVDVVLNLAPTTDGAYSAENDDLGEMVVTYVDADDKTQTLSVADNGDVTVPAGITEITVTVATSDNEIYEGDETFGLVVTDKSNVTTNGSDSSNATIKDDGTGPGDTPDNDKPTLLVTGGGDVNEGSDATFEVSLSNKTEADVVLNLAPTTDGSYSAESDDLGDVVVTYVDDKGDTQSLAVAENGDVTVPAGITGITVTVPTSDNEIYEGDETFGLVVTDKSNVTTNGSDSSDATIKDDGTGTVNDGKPVDNDKPTLVVSDAKSVAEGESATFAVSLSNPVDSTLTYKFELDLSSSAELDDFAAENGSVMLTVTYVVDGEQKSAEIENGGELSIPGHATDMTVGIVTDDNRTFEGQEDFALNVSVSGEVGSDNDSLVLEDSGAGIITDDEDNPPQSENFEVNVGSNGKTQVIFDTANTPIDDGSNPDSDHISDREDDADNAADLKIVITELPDDGTLYYKEGDEFFEITAEHLYSGEGDQNYTQFDPNSIHYEADANSEGFSLGINNQQDSNPLGQPDKGASSQDFYNWGEKVDNTTRELKLSDGETITIRSEGGKLTQYSGDANAQHVGHGIGVGGGKGINEGEKLIVEFESRPADSITLGLDGLGGYFEQGLGSSKESSVVIIVNFVGGSQTFEFQKDSSGSDELFHSITIPSPDFPLPEGTEIASVELSTSGPGNWELRSLETSANDSFDYQAVDSDGNFSEESTVTLNESNNAPIANDDPTNFVVKLGSFNTENNLLWSDDGATITTSANSDESFDPTTLKQGVSDDLNGGPAGQIQYNRETGESEQFIINLDKPATEFSFSVSNLFKNEGGTGNHEQGKWVAYLNGVAVASDTFTANDGNHQGQFDVILGDDENPIAFDEIIFEAQDFVDVPARGNDASDYFVTGFEASSDGAYAVNQGGVLEIPISELLSNDSDIDNDTIRITYVYGETQGEAYIKDGMIHFELNETFVGNTTFEYQITDDKGGFDSATVNVIVNPAPNDAIVNEVQLLSNSVEEGNDLAFKVTLDSSALKETTLDIDFGLLGDKAGESDVDLSDLTFTNGVTYDHENGQITVPVGVKDFTVLVPTEKDGLHELDESYSLQVGGVQGVSATGTIENVDVASLSVVSEGNVSEGSAASFKVSLSVPSSESTELSITTNVSGDNNTAEENDLEGSMKAYFLDDNDEPVELTITDGKVMVPPFITEIFVSVGTQDNAIFEGSEQFELIVSNENGVTSNQSSSAATNIVDDGSVDPDGDGAQSADDDRPVVESISAPIVDEGLDAKFDVKLTNTSESVTPITMSLVDDSAHGGSDYTTTQVTVTYHKNGVEVSETLDVNNGSFTFELPADNDDFTVTVATLDDQHNPVFEGNEHFELIVSTESQQDVTSGQATIQDYQDNPPQSEDFEVNVGSNGKTQVIFDTANTPIDDGSNPDSDHISDREDDADNAADLKIVITELPDDGTLYYKEGDEFFEITAEHLYSGEGDQNYTQFDPNSIHYEADANSEGFSLGINNQQDSNPLGQPDKGASSQDFYNWGEKVNNTTRELKLSDGEIITIRSEGGKLTQYSGDANAQHVGHGIGVGKGINEGEKLIVEFESRPADSITLGLDGLGGYFEQGLGSSKESSVVITVNFVGGSQTFEFQKDSSGSDELFHSITIPSADFPLPEGTEIASVELSTSGPGNWELRSLETSANDSFDYQAVDSDGNFSEESTVTLNESNNAPIANDDPTNFVVKLGSFNTENNLLWSDDGATITTSANSDESFDPTTLKQGVSDDLNGGPAGQIQYNRETGESEQFIINLDKPATEFSFSVSNLFKNEGGTGNHEQGKWVAYLNGVAVASDTFTANDGNHQGQFDVILGDDENPIAFDEIIFEAQDFVDVPARGNDASDYFVTGFEASSDGAYAVNQGGVLEIPISELSEQSELLSNDSDIDNDTIRITYVHGETQGEAYIKDGVIYFELNETFVGNTTFEYQITDDKGGFDSATVNVIVNPDPRGAKVDSVELLSNDVVEGHDLAFKVSLESSALKETTLDMVFGPENNADVGLAKVFFTNGVTFDETSGTITIPVGVKDFTVLVPTLDDSEVESTENYSISVGGVTESGNILDNDDKAPNNTPPKAISIEFDTVGGSQEISSTELVSDTEDDQDSNKHVELRIESEPLFGKIYSLNDDGSRTELSVGDVISESTRIHYVVDPETLSHEGTLDNASLTDSFTYTAIDSEGMESTIESITLSSDNINISSNPEAIDHVRINNYEHALESVLWSAGATHTSPAIDNKPLEGHKEGLFVDVGEGGDTVYLGSGNDTIYLGNSHASLDEHQNQESSITAAQRELIDNYSSGADGEHLETPDDRFKDQDPLNNSMTEFEENSDLTTASASTANLDIAHAGGGDDIVFGEGGSDAIFGGSGDDVIYGGAGLDVLRGGTGDDFIDGGSGNDILIGGLGNDILMGGDYVDIFKFIDQGNGIRDGEIDMIKDFTAGEDKLDLSELLDLESGNSMDQLLSVALEGTDDIVLMIDDGNSSQSIVIEDGGSQYQQHISGDMVDSSAILCDLLNLPDLNNN